MKSVFENFVGRRPCAGAGVCAAPAGAQQPGAGAAAQAGFAGRDRGGQGNPGDEERQRDVRQCRSRTSCSRPRITLLQTNLNYQKDLNEVAVIVAQKLAGREKEIGEGMAKIYANEFTEQELKDLVTFYKSPLGQKLLDAPSPGDPAQHGLYEPVGAAVRRDRQR